MSIYATVDEFIYVDYETDDQRRICVQAVPNWIDYTGPAWDWLPPPVRVDETSRHVRAVFFVDDYTRKGTERCGQEYERPLLVLTGEEWDTLTWHEVMERLRAGVSKVNP